jgi:2-polyprenyl-3-methyl-5-hydroxy-6-metoxy-1,4-benzoquinol methylase
VTFAIQHLHDSYVHSRRIRRLSELLSEMLPKQVSVLDVGCGVGLISHQIQDARSDLAIHGIDVFVAHYGVALTYNYWPRHRWDQTFKELRLTIEQWRGDLGLYAGAANVIF